MEKATPLNKPRLMARPQPNRFCNREPSSSKQEALPITTAFESYPNPIAPKASSVLQAPQFRIPKAMLIPLGVDGPTERVHNPDGKPYRVYHRVTHTPTTPGLHQQQILKKA